MSFNREKLTNQIEFDSHLIYITYVLQYNRYQFLILHACSKRIQIIKQCKRRNVQKRNF